MVDVTFVSIVCNFYGVEIQLVLSLDFWNTFSQRVLGRLFHTRCCVLFPIILSAHRGPGRLEQDR